jgi:hypothetical protein
LYTDGKYSHQLNFQAGFHILPKPLESRLERDPHLHAIYLGEIGGIVYSVHMVESSILYLELDLYIWRQVVGLGAKNPAILYTSLLVDCGGRSWTKWPILQSAIAQTFPTTLMALSCLLLASRNDPYSTKKPFGF